MNLTMTKTLERARGRTVAQALLDDFDLLHPDHGLEEAAQRFADSGLPLLPVVDGDEVVGVMTPADILRGDPCARDDAPAPTVAQRMSTLIPYCRTSDSPARVRDAMATMRAPAALVVDREGALLGLVTRDGLDGYAPADSTPMRRDASEGARHARTPGRAMPERAGRLKSHAMVPRLRR